jgi:hypothetical protein
MTNPQATIGHLALHYRPGDEQSARRLLQLLGCTLVQNGPAPGTDGFTTVVVDGDTWNYVDNVLYLSQVNSTQLALEDAIAERFGAGTDHEDPVLAEYHEARVRQPESLAHVGIRYASFGALERAVGDVEAAAAPGGELEGRVVLTKFRARAGLDPDIDALMESTPIFGPDDRPAFADYGVQCFVKTDLFAAGLLALGQTIELDYFFAPAFETMPDFRRPARAATPS